MYVFRIAAIVLAACLAGPSSAKDDIPDMRGTWTGPANGVFKAAPGPSRKAHYASMEITLVVDEQRDRRFAGTVKTRNSTKPMVGVIGFNGGIWWSEPGGFVDGRLKDADTIEACYVRVSAHSQLAACEELKHQKVTPALADLPVIPIVDAGSAGESLRAEALFGVQPSTTPRHYFCRIRTSPVIAG